MSDNFTIKKGDVLDIVKELDDNNFDAVLCDPPYGLSKEPDIETVLSKWLQGEDYKHRGGGFMKKSWDCFVPGPQIWKELNRVLKPGAHLLSFGGTRTQDLLSIALRMGKFEIRETIMYCYGCISEDTEILTKEGWKKYHKNIKDDLILAYDINSDSYEFQYPEEVYHYGNKHTAYRIYSDYTDQIVSRNHRCIVERSGRKEFTHAETLEQQESVPFLESLSDLPESISYLYERTSGEKKNLFSKMQRTTSIKEENRKKETNRRKKNNRGRMCKLWEKVLQTRLLPSIFTRAFLFNSMQWSKKRGRMSQTWIQGNTWLNRTILQILPRKNEWREQSCMKRWGDVLQEKGKLYWSSICKVSRRIFGNGSQGWLCYGTPIDNGSTFRKDFEQYRSSPSYKSQTMRQQNREFDAISKQSGTQTIRSTTARVEEIEYDGNVWCVKVPYGAFVARRNGKIFITGNSGFPKSYNISKGIDNKFGAEREVVGVKPGHEEFANRKTKGHLHSEDQNDGWKRPWKEREDATNYHLQTAPTTEEAQKWEGYGTNIKPAYEPIILARKRPEKSIVNNCLKFGVGGINIDDCRISHNEEVKTTDRQKNQGETWNNENIGFLLGLRDNPTNIASANQKGRFPANFTHDGSEEVLGLFPDSNGQQGDVKNHNKSRQSPNGCYGEMSPAIDHFKRNDSGSAARFFYTAKVSPKERNAGLEDMEDNYLCQGYSDQQKENKDRDIELNKSKKVKNDHPTVKPIDLCRYLATLILPPERETSRKILVPFSGSGSEMIGALLAGWDYVVGIELDENYIDIAEKRILYWTKEQIDDKVEEESKDDKQNNLIDLLFK